MDFLTIFLRGIVANLRTRYAKLVALLAVIFAAAAYGIDTALGWEVCDAASVCTDYVTDGLRETLTAVKRVLVIALGLLGLPYVGPETTGGGSNAPPRA